MKVAFLTHGLTFNNAHLMPWRYVIEIAKAMTSDGHNVTIVTDGPDRSDSFPSNFPPVIMVNGAFTRKNSFYGECIASIKPDVIYFPVARRSSLKNGILSRRAIPHIAYYPSAWYQPLITLKGCRRLPLSEAFTYLLESLVPGAWLVRALKKQGVTAVATVTEYTAKFLVKSGWPESRIKAFPPGLDRIRAEESKSEVFRRHIKKLDGKRYLLFMGPAKAIRGVYSLLKAFDRAAQKERDIFLVCLIRGDAGQNSRKLKSILADLENHHHIFIIDERLGQDDIMSFIEGSHAVALPFLIVPSEIPLAVLEALSCGKPVLITETGGTSRFVGKAGIVVSPDDAQGLAEGILDIFTDRVLYSSMCREAQDLMGRHPRWKQVAKDYLDFTNRVLSISSESIIS